MIDRNESPALTPLSIPKLLSYRKFFLTNGVEIVYMNDPSQEIFKIDVTFEAGVYYQSQPLLASTTVNMLNEGTSRHAAKDIAELFDYYGACINFQCGLNKTEISLISLNKYAGETLSMLSEIIMESNIPEKELETYLANKQQEHLIEKEKTAFLARKKFFALLFGTTHPYANQIQSEDFQKITTNLVLDFYRQYYQAESCRIVICGRVDESILTLIAQAFGQLPRKLPLPSKEQKFHPEAPGLYRIEKANCVQSSLRIGKSGVRLTDEDYADFMLLNTILGGYFGSRLMSNIREEKGYTYGIHSFNVSMPIGSCWNISADVSNEHAEDAVEEAFKEIKRLQTEPIPAEELTLVKNFLHGDLLRELDGVFAQSDSLKNKLTYGLDNNIYSDLIQRIRKCSSEDLLQLAHKYLNTEEMYVVIAGKT